MGVGQLLAEGGVLQQVQEKEALRVAVQETRWAEQRRTPGRGRGRRVREQERGPLPNVAGVLWLLPVLQVVEVVDHAPVLEIAVDREN